MAKDLKIYFTVSPFVYKPIYYLCQLLGYEPQSNFDKICLCLINPLHEPYRAAKKFSHHTEAQTTEHQIRYLGKSEIAKKLQHLARCLQRHIKKRKITFITPFFPHAFNATNLNQFITYLNAIGSQNIYIKFEQKANPEAASLEKETLHIEDLYFYEEKKRLKEAKPLLKAAKTCSNSGDYYSAILLMQSITDLGASDPDLTIDFYLHLAMCYRAINDPIASLFYYNLSTNAPKLRQRKAAYYGLSMLYIKQHAPQYRNTEKAAQFLEQGHQELLKEPETPEIKVDKVFNRNGYALVLFKQGYVQEAQTLVESGIDCLNKVTTDYSAFHKTVLYYNVFQCMSRSGAYDTAEETMLKLLQLDNKFFFYYAELAEFYYKTNALHKALHLLETAIKIDPYYFKFYYIYGKIKFLQKDYVSSLKKMQIAYDINPSDLASLSYLTTLHNLFGHYSDTLKLVSNFSVRYHNNDLGELIFMNKIAAHIYIHGTSTALQKEITAANKIRSLPACITQYIG